MTVLLGIFTFVLVLISIFMVLIILAQRAKSDGGVGAALGGGVTEAAFGAESGNVLSRATTVAAVGFFVLSFALYLGHLYLHKKEMRDMPAALPELVAPPSQDPLAPPIQDPLASPLPEPVENAPGVTFGSGEPSAAAETPPTP